MALEVFPFGGSNVRYMMFLFPFCFFQVPKKKMPKNHETSCGGHFLPYRMETSCRQSNKKPISQMYVVDCWLECWLENICFRAYVVNPLDWDVIAGQANVCGIRFCARTL
jgi:hypothetical protein